VKYKVFVLFLFILFFSETRVRVRPVDGFLRAIAIDPSAAPPPLFWLARRPKFGWRRRETFPAAAEFGATS